MGNCKCGKGGCPCNQSINELKEENKSLGKQIGALRTRYSNLQSLSFSIAYGTAGHTALRGELDSLANRIQRKQDFHAGNIQQLGASA